MRRPFRHDINALRALSVAAVVGFHLRVPGFHGGFVGVDSFLVITGYLMMTKVVSELQSDRFSAVSFWAARMRRIYPALAVLVIATILIGWFLTFPDQYLKHLLQSLTALTFLSNFAFDTDSGYFSLPAKTKILLHTWSLSVEWQFYFWMPLVVAAAWRYRAHRSKAIERVRYIAWLVLAASLAWCLWKSYSDATASSFFSLRSRAWEPLAGGLIAIAELRNTALALQRRTVAILGWALVIGCTAAPFPEADWPGLYTIIPILGAALIVVANQPFSILRLAGIQRIGDWSYSIYLWHWPMWVFALGWMSLRGYEFGATAKALIVGASVIAGALSYYAIEQPVRSNKTLWTNLKLVRTSVYVFAACAILTILAFVNDGFPSRLPDYIRPAELARRTGTPRGECFRDQNSEKKAPATYCSFGDTASRPSMLLWGDSFANQYLEPIDSAARLRHIHGLIATQSACRPLVESGNNGACSRFNRETLGFALGAGAPSTIIVGGNWPNAREPAAVVDKLLEAGKRVILIMPLLHIGFDVPQRWIETQVRSGKPIETWAVPASSSLVMESLRHGFQEMILTKHRDNPNLVTVDPQSAVCDEAVCYLVRNGQANFRDSAHISNVNAMQYSGLFDSAMDTLP